jgi:ubiquitin C-terminal hydrolase
MTKAASVTIAVLLHLSWAFPALAASPCNDVKQNDRDSLIKCIDELHKEIDRNRSDIDKLKEANTSISKQLCMLAIEQHRKSARSEALQRLIENICGEFKNFRPPGNRL